MSNIRPCGNDLSRFERLEPIEVNIERTGDAGGGIFTRLMKRDAEKRLAFIPITEDVVELFPQYIRDAICRYTYETASEAGGYGFYITADIHSRLKELTKSAATEMSGAFSKGLGAKGGLLEIENEQFGVTANEVAEMMKHPPPMISGNADRTVWRLVEEPWSDILVAQIRAACMKNGIEYNIFRRADGSSNYYIVGDAEVLSYLEDTLNIIKGRMIVNGETADKAEKFNAKVIYEISKIKSNLKTEAERGRTWNVEEIAGTIGLVGVLAFGIGAPLGHDVYSLLKRKVVDMVRRGPKGPIPPASSGGGQGIRTYDHSSYSSSWDCALSVPGANSGYITFMTGALLASAYISKNVVSAILKRITVSELFMFTLAAPSAMSAEGEFLRYKNRVGGNL